MGDVSPSPWAVHLIMILFPKLDCKKKPFSSHFWKGMAMFFRPGAQHVETRSEFGFATPHLPEGGGGIIPPTNLDFIVGNIEICKIWKYSFRQFFINRLLDFWVPDPPL